MLATPTTAGPVWNSVDKPPTESATVRCAGQNLSGTHCTTSLSTQANLPVIAGADVTAMARSAAARSGTGRATVTTTGCATPTTAPRAGSTEAMSSPSDCFAAATLTAAGAAITPAAIPTTASTPRTTVRMTIGSF